MFQYSSHGQAIDGTLWREESHRSLLAECSGIVATLGESPTGRRRALSSTSRLGRRAANFQNIREQVFGVLQPFRGTDTRPRTERQKPPIKRGYRDETRGSANGGSRRY